VTQSRALAAQDAAKDASHSHGGRTMKKLFMLAMAAAFSMAMVAPGFAQTTGTTEKKADATEKKSDEKMDKKAEKKKT
jgi:hypothetical protein